MGVSVSKKVGARLGKTILELGGNNAIIITPNADLVLRFVQVFLGQLVLVDNVVHQQDV